MGDSARRQRGVCRHHGRRPGSLSATARSAAPARVPRRNLEAADHRDARADPRQTWTTSAPRLRIRTQWHRPSVHGVRAAGRLAACQGHRPPHRHRLCPRAQGFVRHAFSDTAKMVLVQDHLNIHKPASLYEAFPAPEARRLVERFEWHYTPKHGSWLELAESNSAFSRRNVWIAASLTSKSSPTKSPHGRTTATSTTPKPTGNSQPPTPASS